MMTPEEKIYSQAYVSCFECSLCENDFENEYENAEEGVIHDEDTDFDVMSENLYPDLTPQHLKEILINKSFCCQECEVQYIRKEAYY